MATVAEHHRMHFRGRETGSAATLIGGGAAIILAILGLVHVSPGYLASIATIAIGVSLLVEGGTIFAWFSQVVDEGRSDPSATAAELEGGMTAEFLAGMAGIILGILAVLGIATEILLASAVIVFGAALLLDSEAMSRLNAIPILGVQTRPGAEAAGREAVHAATGARILVGVSSIVLGIIALASARYSGILILVALLIVGVSILVSGSALTSRMVGGREST